MKQATPDTPITAIRQWICESAGLVDDGALHADTDLLEAGYIDSLGLIGLILLVEKLRGAQIGEQQMSAQNFMTLERIEQTFFSGSMEHA